MRIKARLTTRSLRQGDDPPRDPAHDSDLDSLARFFPTDPIVAMDADGWYLSATAMDQADDDDVDNVPRRPSSVSAWELLNRMNGVSRLLRSAYGIVISDVELTGVYEGARFGATVDIAGIMGYSHQHTGYDPVSALELLRLAVTEPPVARMLALFTRANSEWFWFDMYRIYEQVRGGFADPAFETWASALHAGWGDRLDEFEDSANNPALGNDRRHGKRDYKQRIYKSSRLPLQPMNRNDAVNFIKQLVVHWIEEEYQVKLDPQFVNVL